MNVQRRAEASLSILCLQLLFVLVSKIPHAVISFVSAVFLHVFHINNTSEFLLHQTGALQSCPQGQNCVIKKDPTLGLLQMMRRTQQ